MESSHLGDIVIEWEIIDMHWYVEHRTSASTGSSIAEDTRSYSVSLQWGKL